MARHVSARESGSTLIPRNAVSWIVSGSIIALIATPASAGAAERAAPKAVQAVPAAPPDPDAPQARAFIADLRDSVDRMQGAMKAVPVVGDPDRDFANLMLPHHQGAVDIAQLYLQRGKDPELQRLARKMIAAQQKDIVKLRKWLEQHPKPMALQPQQPQGHAEPSLLSAR